MTQEINETNQTTTQQLTPEQMVVKGLFDLYVHLLSTPLNPDDQETIIISTNDMRSVCEHIRMIMNITGVDVTVTPAQEEGQLTVTLVEYNPVADLEGQNNA